MKINEDLIKNVINVDTSINDNSLINITKSKNIFDGLLEQGGFNESTGVKKDGDSNYRNANPIPVKPNTTYTSSINGTAQQYVMLFYNKNKIFLKSADNRTGTFTTPTNCYYVNFRCYFADYTSDFYNLKIQFEEGSSATEYVINTPTSININSHAIYNDSKILFDNSNGELDDIKLIQDRTNYKYLEIYFIDDQDYQNSIKIDTSDNPFQMQFLKSGVNRGAMYLIATRMYWSSNTLLKRGTTTIYNIISSTVSENTTADVLKITKIIGYK